jgi:hypothetical protein
MPQAVPRQQQIKRMLNLRYQIEKKTLQTINRFGLE